MLVIRLRRTGKKNQPSFRLVVTDKRRAADKGIPVEEVGFYNPLTKERKLSKERIVHWLSVGAKASDTVHNMLVSEKVIEGSKSPKHGKSKKPAQEAKPAEAPKAEEKPVQEAKTEEAPAPEPEKTEEATPVEEEVKEEKKKEEPASLQEESEAKEA